MCWTTKDKKYITKNIAKNDILVHKIVRVRNKKEVQKKFLFWSKTVIEKEILSYCQLFKYKLGETYRIDQKIIVESSRPHEGEFFAAIDEGFHSYSKNCSITGCSGKYYRVFSKDSSTCSFTIYSDCRIMVCIIPKGSVYYENEHGEIVSNRIKPISIE